MKYRDYRWPCAYEVEVTCGAQVGRATVVNVTQAGACLIDVPRVEAGDVIDIHFLGRRIPAEVRWARRGRCGVRFEARLGQQDLATIRQMKPGHGSVRRLRPMREMR